jgi:inosose dehydratase
MSVRLGINPIGWTNDCMSWLGGLIPLENCLAEARAAGFAGIELGRKFPRSPAKLKPILERHGLALVSGWYSARLLERSAREEIQAMKPHFDLLQGLGSEVMVWAESTGDIINDVSAPASRRPKISGAGDWKRLGKRMSEVADHMSAHGMRMAVHHHMGTVIESETDVDRLMENSEEAVGLLLDTGHMTLAGGEPVAVAQRYAKRICHVHCKDIRRYALESCRRQDLSFSHSVLSGIFTAPGDGIVDYPKILQILAQAGYGGWLVQEAEQDPRLADPRIYAELGNQHLRQVCGRAKLPLAA